MTPHFLFSAPARVEIGGNHTDHQHGCVLAAAVNLEITAKVVWNRSNTIRVFSEGYSPVEIALDDLSVQPEERNTTAALVRGTAASFAKIGAALKGFDAYVSSSIPAGSGLSSSAAFEVLMGTAFNSLFLNRALSPVQIAQIGQYVENQYFGKPCGLMDQAASAVGGFVFMDFSDPASPAVRQIPFDFSKSGHVLCIIDSGADHADMTDEYAAIPEEMKSVARYFGKQVLAEVAEPTFYDKLPKLRQAVGDRAVLRCIHFYRENARVIRQAQALEKGNFPAFLQLVDESGRSSWTYLQNVISPRDPRRQEVAVALALCDRLLNGKGAFRVHGGGFAGTVQAFVPAKDAETFCREIDVVLGKGACRILSVRNDGGKELPV